MANDDFCLTAGRLGGGWRAGQGGRHAAGLGLLVWPR